MSKKEIPNYKPSGNLVGEGCWYKGVFLKWDEPPDMHLPKLKWKVYVFKGDEAVGKPIPIFRQPGCLFGRDFRIADITLEHQSTSSQHAVLYFRKLAVTSKDKITKNVIKPFIMDLKSTNGTFLNKISIEPFQYYEIKQGDLVNFGQSTRDYIFLPEESVRLSVLEDDSSDSDDGETDTDKNRAGEDFDGGGDKEKRMMGVKLMEMRNVNNTNRVVGIKRIDVGIGVDVKVGVGVEEKKKRKRYTDAVDGEVEGVPEVDEKKNKVREKREVSDEHEIDENGGKGGKDHHHYHHKLNEKERREENDEEGNDKRKRKKIE